MSYTRLHCRYSQPTGTHARHRHFACKAPDDMKFTSKQQEDEVLTQAEQKLQSEGTGLTDKSAPEKVILEVGACRPSCDEEQSILGLPERVISNSLHSLKPHVCGVCHLNAEGMQWYCCPTSCVNATTQLVEYGECQTAKAVCWKQPCLVDHLWLHCKELKTCPTCKPNRQSCPCCEQHHAGLPFRWQKAKLCA